MKIGAALGFNLIDYPGKIAAVAFTPGCNYRCPHCHAAPLLAGAKDLGDQGFLEYLDTVREWVTGVTICGGEPTLQEGLIPFISSIGIERSGGDRSRPAAGTRTESRPHSKNAAPIRSRA